MVINTILKMKKNKINTKLCHIEIKHDDKNIKYVVRIFFTQGGNYFKHYIEKYYRIIMYLSCYIVVKWVMDIIMTLAHEIH